MDKDSTNRVDYDSYKELYEAICKNKLKSIEINKHNNCKMNVYIDMRKSINEIIIFYESKNGVILKEEQLSPKYLRFETI